MIIFILNCLEEFDTFTEVNGFVIIFEILSTFAFEFIGLNALFDSEAIEFIVNDFQILLVVVSSLLMLYLTFYLLNYFSFISAFYQLNHFKP